MKTLHLNPDGTKTRFPLFPAPAPAPAPASTLDESQLRRQHAAEILLRKLRISQNMAIAHDSYSELRYVDGKIGEILRAFPTLK